MGVTAGIRCIRRQVHVWGPAEWCIRRRMHLWTLPDPGPPVAQPASPRVREPQDRPIRPAPRPRRPAIALRYSAAYWAAERAHETSSRIALRTRRVHVAVWRYVSTARTTVPN